MNAQRNKQPGFLFMFNIKSRGKKTQKKTAIPVFDFM